MNRLVKYASMTIAIMAFSQSVSADTDLQISVAEINGYGIFETGGVTGHAGMTADTMGIDKISHYAFKEFTREVPPVLGTNFGFQYQLNTTPRGQKIRVKHVIRFPEPGLVSPRGKVYRESVERLQVTIGKDTLHGYGFDEPWEIVPGEWTFEVWYKDARIVRKTFVVLDKEV